MMHCRVYHAENRSHGADAPGPPTNAKKRPSTQKLFYFYIFISIFYGRNIPCSLKTTMYRPADLQIMMVFFILINIVIGLNSVGLYDRVGYIQQITQIYLKYRPKT